MSKSKYSWYKNIFNIKLYFRRNRPTHFVFIILFITIIILYIYFINYKNRIIYSSVLRKYNIEWANLKNNRDSNLLSISKANIEKNTKAKAFIIYDITANKEIYSKNRNSVEGLASLSKLMTIYTLKRECPILADKYIPSILIESSNIKSELLSEECIKDKDLFIQKMNKYAREISPDFVFYNSTGLEIDKNNVGNKGSINGLLQLLIRLDKDYPDLYKYIYKYKYKYKNTNPYLNKWPFLFFTKTGWTELAGGNLVSIFNITANQKIAIIILGSDKNGRFTETERLLNWYLENY